MYRSRYSATAVEQKSTQLRSHQSTNQGSCNTETMSPSSPHRRQMDPSFVGHVDPGTHTHPPFWRSGQSAFPTLRDDRPHAVPLGNWRRYTIINRHPHTTQRVHIHKGWPQNRSNKLNLFWAPNLTMHPILQRHTNTWLRRENEKPSHTLQALPRS